VTDRESVQIFDSMERQTFHPVPLADIQLNGGAVTWIDLHAPSREEIHALGARFQFHPLAVEDAIKLRQRPKLDAYQNHLFIVLYELDFEAERQQVDTRELAVFVNGNVVVTVHSEEISALRVAERRWAEHCRESQQMSAGMLVYTIADAIVDGYFPCMDKIAEDIDELETRMFSDSVQDVLQEIFTLKRSLLDLRRLVAPTREVFNSFTRREVAVLGEGAVIYFQDIYDHVIRVTDAIDADRDVLSSAIDVHLSLQSNRMNQTVRTLTAASIVLMSMTLIAGIYGMNFAHMPELEWRYGYFITLGAIMLVGLVVAWAFRRLRWW
jgi:magnesium transporter